MGGGFATLQCAVTVLMYAGAALGAGAGLSALWLSRSSGAWAAARLPALRRCTLAACALALLASAAVLWLESAAMAEVPAAEAAPAVRLMLVSTHYGHAWSLGTAALTCAGVLPLLMPRRRARATAVVALSALAVFWLARSSVSHAAGDGGLLPVIVDWVHLALVSAWLGEVCIAGLLVLPGPQAASATDRRDRARYVMALSSTATVALSGILATGLFSTWQRIDDIGELFGSAYGRTLLAKVAVVACAVLLGAFNRFFVMPGWVAEESAGALAPPCLGRRFGLVLRVEALVLCAVLVLAILLAATPPGSSAA